GCHRSPAFGRGRSRDNPDKGARARPGPANDRRPADRVARDLGAARARGTLIQGDRRRDAHPDRHRYVAAVAGAPTFGASGAPGRGGMSAMPDCNKVLLVQAELDGELGAAEAASLAAHRAECPICQTAAAELMQARALIRDDLYQPVADDVRQRIMAALDAARPAPRPQPSAAATPGVSQPGLPQWWRGWRLPWWSSGASFGLGAACAA